MTFKLHTRATAPSLGICLVAGCLALSAQHLPAVAQGAPPPPPRATSLVAPVAPSGAPTVAQDGKRKVNFAGRQRMLSQRMAKSACFASLGVDVVSHISELKAAHALFDVTLTGLQFGSPTQGMLAETEPGVLAALQAVTTVWTAYGSGVAAIGEASPTRGDVKLLEVYALSVPILQDADYAVSMLEQKYETGTALRPGLASALNVSGRQRMLSQKMGKELCMIASDHEPPITRAQLIGTLALFRSSHDQLRSRLGGLQLPAELNGKLTRQFAVIEGLWRGLEPIFDRVAAGATPPRADIERVAAENRALLDALNTAVVLYEQTP